MKNVKKFCLPNRFFTTVILLIVFIVFYGIMLLSVVLQNDIDDISSNFPLIAIIGFVITFLVLFGFYYEIIIKTNKRFKKRLKYFKANNLEPYIISDFNNGIKMFQNNVIVGEYCLIGKGDGLIVFYNEIDSFSCFINSSTDDNGNSSVTKELRVGSRGIEYRLCNVNEWNLYQPDYNQLCNFLKIKNPNIIIK